MNIQELKKELEELEVKIRLDGDNLGYKISYIAILKSLVARYEKAASSASNSTSQKVA